MHDKRPLWILSGIIVGIGISLCLTSATAKIQGFKTPKEKQKTIKKYELKQEYKNAVITKNTVESNAERISRLEKMVFNEKGN